MSVLYFALVDSDETTFLAEYERNDLDVKTFTLSQNENEFATLTLDIRNPRIGLLNASQKQWLWFSVADQSTDGARPLFFGRIVAVPEDPQGNIVTITFVARPIDLEAQKAALATTLKVYPWWDPVWIAAERRMDPEAVLDARTARWHTDRVTHEVTISDTITGEDGTIDFAGDFIRDSLSIQIGQPAVRKVHVEAEVDWDQRARGSINLTPLLLQRAALAGSGDGNVITTYTGEGLASDWPEKGDDIGAGWSFGLCTVTRGDHLWVSNPDDVTVILPNIVVAMFPLWSFKPTLRVRYDASRSRSETVSFDLVADVQALVTEPGDEETLQIALASSDVDAHIDPGGLMPIGNPARRTYFKTARGHRSLEYVISLARKELLERSRAVTIGFDVGWLDAIEANCRQNARITDPRLPGGEAAGKIIGYVISGDGDSGIFGGKITIGAMVGNGATITESAGDPDWVDDEWVDEDWQTRTGSVIMPIAGEVTYNDYNDVPFDDDGINFFNMGPSTVVQHLNIIDGAPVQKAVLEAFQQYADTQGALDAVNEVCTLVDLQLVPLNGGPYHTDFPITVSTLMVPKTIDLAAASA